MDKRIEVPALARVEGEGGLFIRLENGQAAEVRLDIYEPPRFFEGFLQGRYLQEVPDITARICGICPVAYQMSAVKALEKALGVKVTPEIRDLRRLMYCAEFIESHALHIFMLQAPDLLGYDSGLELAADAPEVVGKALRLKKAGNALLEAIGGRSVHPVSACVGGFYQWPAVEKIDSLLPELHWGLEAAVESTLWAAGLRYPEMQVDYEFVALTHPDEYAILEGEIFSSKYGAIAIEDFEQAYPEKQVRHSNALHSLNREEQPYLVGPLARLNLNHTKLGPEALELLETLQIELPLCNPYKSLIARAIELVEAFAQAIRLVEGYAPAGASRLQLPLRAGSGCAASEAPRGLLYHRYEVDLDGFIQQARIVPPTAQNLSRIEADLRTLAPKVIEKTQEEATLDCEHLIRAYDPCISCATHFLQLRIDGR